MKSYDRIDELAKRPEDIFGVPTGFIDLDRKLMGLQPSDLLIIAGRPGQGKSGFLLSVAKNAALLHKKHVAIFSLEMSNEQVVQRLIAQETGIDSQRLRTGKLDEDEWPIIHPCHRSAWRYAHLPGRYPCHHPAGPAHQMPPPAHGISAST